VSTFIGLPENVWITGGPTLVRDARHGNDHDDIRTRSEVREPIGEPLSEKVSFLHGPHPERESDFNLLCEEVVAYLLDP
jgi:hypothetical protein